MLAASPLDAYGQLYLELMNRARADPAGEAARTGGPSLNAGLSGDRRITATPKEPLVASPALTVAADTHAVDMIDRDYFSHNAGPDGPLGASNRNRQLAAGFEASWWGENIAQRGTSDDGGLDLEFEVIDTHAGLYASATHRPNLMGENFDSVGVGYAQGPITGRNQDDQTVTVPFGLRVVHTFGGSERGVEGEFITGVVYSDARSGADNDSFYSIGEGRGGGQVSAYDVATGEEFRSPVGAAGGYAVNVPSGEYDVVLRRGSRVWVDYGVAVSDRNVKVDFELTTAEELPEGEDYDPRPAADGPSLDLVSYEGGRFRVTAGDPAGEFASRTFAWGAGVDWQDMQFGDFNNDGLGDVAAWDPETGEWNVGLSDGQTFSREVWGRWNPAAGWRQIQVGDFTGDGYADLAARTSEGSWWVMENQPDGEGGRQLRNHRRARWTTRFEWNDIEVGDFNGDGRDDIAGFVRGTWWASDRLDRAYGPGQSRLMATLSVNQEWDHFEVADFNSDGRDDLAAVRRNKGEVYVALSPTAGGGLSRFRLRADFADARAREIVVGQFDAQGELDVAIRFASGRVSMGFGLTNGTFRPTGGRQFMVEPSVDTVERELEFAVAADLTGDGVDELAFFDPAGRWLVADPWAGRPEDVDLAFERLATGGSGDPFAFLQFDGV